MDFGKVPTNVFHQMLQYLPLVDLASSKRVSSLFRDEIPNVKKTLTNEDWRRIGVPSWVRAREPLMTGSLSLQNLVHMDLSEAGIKGEAVHHPIWFCKLFTTNAGCLKTLRVHLEPNWWDEALEHIDRLPFLMTLTRLTITRIDPSSGATSQIVRGLLRKCPNLEDLHLSCHWSIKRDQPATWVTLHVDLSAYENLQSLRLFGVI